MLVDVYGNEICVKDIAALKAYQRSQLFSWGFRKQADSSLVCVGEDRLLIELLDFFDAEKIMFELSSGCALRVEQCKRTIEEFRKVKLIATDFKEGRILPEFAAFTAFLKESIRRPLKPHQIKAAFHLYIIRNGANFSVPGSGKSTVVLSVYEKLKTEGVVNRLFIVGPPSCFTPWQYEFEATLGRAPSWKIFAGGEKISRKSAYLESENEELVLTSYQTLLNDEPEVLAYLNQKSISAFLVIDEAHYMKQAGGVWAGTIIRIARYAKRRCVLTGTPMPKSYADIFNMFDFLWPVEKPIPDKNKVQIKLWEKSGQHASVIPMLNTDVNPFFYRVRKIDLKLCEPKFHPPILIQMNPYERLIYEAIENRIRSYAQKEFLENINVVRALWRGRLMRLRQCVSYAKLLASGIEGYGESLVDAGSNLAKCILNYDSLEMPAKMARLTELVLGFHSETKKVIIWANFVGTLKFMKSLFLKNGIACEIIYGETPVAAQTVNEEFTRSAIIERFKQEGSGLDVLIANPAACAESISLHKTCFNAVYYDLSYNCAQYLQSLDRIHRVGGSEKNVANYYFLQYQDTIEENIKQNLDDKAERMFRVIEQDSLIYTSDVDDDEGIYVSLYGQ